MKEPSYVISKQLHDDCFHRNPDITNCTRYCVEIFAQEWAAENDIFPIHDVVYVYYEGRCIMGVFPDGFSMNQNKGRGEPRFISIGIGGDADNQEPANWWKEQ